MTRVQIPGGPTDPGCLLAPSAVDPPGQGLLAMPEDRTEDESVARNTAQFATTHWSVVLAAGDSASPDSQEALENLCRAYWYPLYVFLRRQGHDPEHARDLTQGFFEHLLRHRGIRVADPERGRFRTFLLACLRNYVRDQYRKEQAHRRSAEWVSICEAEERYLQDVTEERSPETEYDRRWALTLLEAVLNQLQAELGKGRESEFRRLKSYLCSALPPPYHELAKELGTTESALRVRVHRWRVRYRDLLRSEVSRTVASTEEVDAEIRYLVSVMAS